METKVKELLNLLTAKTLDDDRLETLTAEIFAEAEDVENAWRAESFPVEKHPAILMNHAFFYVLEGEEIFLTSDSWRDVHDQLCAQFEEPLPELPATIEYLGDYLIWIDGVLKDWGWELVDFPEMGTDNLTYLCVDRDDTEQIRELSKELTLPIKPALEVNQDPSPFIDGLR
ncbi:hypothetical protein [Cupriavidus plantarum]|uniref:hypothetical protein n=1 Tax=Cupriavidus plantarum TaxID=942865 RepID=UPI00339D6C5D